MSGWGFERPIMGNDDPDKSEGLIPYLKEGETYDLSDDPQVCASKRTTNICVENRKGSNAGDITCMGDSGEFLDTFWRVLSEKKIFKKTDLQRFYHR